MFFQSNLNLRLSRASHIQAKKPDRIFAKFLYYLSAGSKAEREEQQLFTAVAIMQELNRILRLNGLTNLHILQVDDDVYYQDTQNRLDDLKVGMETMVRERAHIDQPIFEHLSFTVSKQVQGLDLFVDIDIRRIHSAKKPPIRIDIKGFFKGLDAKPGEDHEAQKTRMAQLFSSKEEYDRWVAQQQDLYQQQVELICKSLSRHLGTEQLEVTHKRQILRELKPTSGRWRPKSRFNQHHYYHDDDGLLYTLLWMNLIQEHSLTIEDVSLIDSEENLIGDIEGELPLESPLFDGEIEGDQAFFDYLEETKIVAWNDVEDSSSDSGGDGGSSGGSSCGSSCGGGCG